MSSTPDPAAAGRGLLGRLSAGWLGRRNFVLLYRGQREPAERILSPLARRDPAAAEDLLTRMRAAGLDDMRIAGYAARWHEHPVPALAAPPGLGGLPLGAVGIAATAMVGLAVHHAAGGVVHVLKLPQGAAHPPLGWPCLELEAEHVVLGEVPQGGVARTVPAAGVPSLMVDARDRLAPGR
jgi:hypothetical protein